MFTSARFFAAGLVAGAVLALALPAAASAAADEYVVDGVIEWVWVPAKTETVRVYQGTSWVWSPARGWHRHDHFACVPRVVPGHWEKSVRMLDVFSR